MASRHRRPSTPAPENRHFVRELRGEEAPRFATLQKLHSLAMEMSGGEPWGDLNESEVFFFPAGKGELRVGSVSGEGGESLALNVFKDYATFRNVESVGRRALRAEEFMGEFVGVQNTLRAEFVDSEDLTPPDRALLKALRHPFSKQELHPQFRSIRPGYLPWYVTEDEARVLINGIEALRFLIETLRTDEDLDFWSTAGSLPLVDPNPVTGHYSVRLVPIPAQEQSAPVFAVTAQEIDAALSLPQSHADWATDLLYILAPVGEEHQRPSLARMAIVLDLLNFEGHHVKTVGAGPSAGELLCRELLNFIQNIGARPVRLLVDRADYLPLLEPLTEALQIKLARRRRIPVLAEVRLAILDRLLELDEDGEFDDFDDDFEE